MMNSMCNGLIHNSRKQLRSIPPFPFFSIPSLSMCRKNIMCICESSEILKFCLFYHLSQNAQNEMFFYLNPIRFLISDFNGWLVFLLFNSFLFITWIKKESFPRWRRCCKYYPSFNPYYSFYYYWFRRLIWKNWRLTILKLLPIMQEWEVVD